jgi:hypothetical protein
VNPGERSGSGWNDCSYLLEPPPACLYRVRDRAGTIIYIGMTLQFIEERFTAYRHRYARRRNGSWWHLAASVEVMTVPAAIVRHAEAMEIHEHHPRYNSQCYHCGREREAHGTMYAAWNRMRREHWNRVHPSWRESLETFVSDVEKLIGPRPPEMTFRLVDPHGRWEPGNICWGRRGSYHQPR